MKTPDFFDALYSNNENIFSEYVESGKEKIFGKEFQYDKYLVKRTLKNGKIAEESYFLYYDETKNLKNIMGSLLDEENYTRAGNGTNEEGLNYFDVKSVTDEDSLKAIRYYFEGNTIKKLQ